MAASIEAVQQLDDIIFQLAVISLFNIFGCFHYFLNNYLPLIEFNHS